VKAGWSGCSLSSGNLCRASDLRGWLPCEAGSRVLRTAAFHPSLPFGPPLSNGSDRPFPDLRSQIVRWPWMTLSRHSTRQVGEPMPDAASRSIVRCTVRSLPALVAAHDPWWSARLRTGRQADVDIARGNVNAPEPDCRPRNPTNQGLDGELKVRSRAGGISRRRCPTGRLRCRFIYWHIVGVPRVDTAFPRPPVAPRSGRSSDPPGPRCRSAGALDSRTGVRGAARAFHPSLV
jgi:hypothetical protein